MSTIDEKLVSRVNQLFRDLETIHLRSKGMEVTEQAIKRAKGWRTVSITIPIYENGRIGKAIITANNTQQYRLMQQHPELLQHGEVLGSRPVTVNGPIPTDAEKAAAKAAGRRARSPRQMVHAEQLGANDARRLGASQGLIATSNKGCSRQCLPLLAEEFPGFRHVNPADGAVAPARKTKQPPRIPRTAGQPRFAPTDPKAISASGEIDVPDEDAKVRKARGTSRGSKPHGNASSASSAGRSADIRLGAPGENQLRTGTRFPSPATNSRGFTKTSKLRAFGGAASKALDVVSVDALDLATRPLNLGFISSLVIGLTVQVMLYVLEKRLAKVNAEGVGREYKSEVFEKIRHDRTGLTLEEYVSDAIQRIRTDPGDFKGLDKKRLKQYVYAEYSYDVWMSLQANDPSDVVVFFLKGLSFVEVYKDAEPVGQFSDYGYSSPLPESRIMTQKRRMFSDKNLVRYRYAHKMLIYDPIVYQRYVDLWNWFVMCRNALNKIVKRLSGDSKQLAKLHGNVALKMIQNYEFLDAINYLDGKHRYSSQLGKLPEQTRRQLFGLKQRAKAGDQVVRDAKKLQADRKALLLMYVGHDIFSDRKKAQRNLRKLSAKERRSQEPARDPHIKYGGSMY